MPKRQSERLLDVEPAEKWRGSKALVPVDRSSCPMCGGVLVGWTARQGALFRHGGYGATMETDATACVGPACGWSLTISATETRPDRW